MSDLKITIFGGIRNDVTAKEINPGQFVDGQNFNIDIFGSLIKRKGCSKLYDSALTHDGAIVMIGDLLTKWGKRKRYFVELGDYHWTDDPVIPFPGPETDDPAIDPGNYDNPATTGCCNYGSSSQYCASSVTISQCLNTLNGNYWKEGGDCTSSSENNCVHNTGYPSVQGYAFTATIDDVVTGSGTFVNTSSNYWVYNGGTPGWFISFYHNQMTTVATYLTGSEPSGYSDRQATVCSGGDTTNRSFALDDTENVTFYYSSGGDCLTKSGTIKIYRLYS